MTQARGKELQKDELRQEMMDAARELFVEKGYDNVSMRKIAEKIGYSPTTIYLYFEDKADLLHQICEQAFAKLAKSILSISKRDGDPETKLRNGLREYIRFGLKHPSEFELVLIAPLPGKESPNGRAAFDTLRDAVAECISAGVFKNQDLELISQTLWVGVHGVTSLLIKHKEFPFVERNRLIASVLDALIRGLKS